MHNDELKAIIDTQRLILAELDNINYGDDKTITFGEKMAAKVVGFIGSWKFIIMQSVLLSLWIAINVAWWANAHHWDPYPFILLNLMLSFQAAYSSPLILMAQNMADRKERRKSTEAYRSISSIENMMSKMQSRIEVYKNGANKDAKNE